MCLRGLGAFGVFVRALGGWGLRVLRGGFGDFGVQRCKGVLV